MKLHGFTSVQFLSEEESVKNLVMHHSIDTNNATLKFITLSILLKAASFLRIDNFRSNLLYYPVQVRALRHSDD